MESNRSQDTSQNDTVAGTLVLAKDAVSSGQIGSKQWLIQILERLLLSYRSTSREPMTVWIYGGWQGVLGFMLFCREGSESAVPIDCIRSFDLDPSATNAANTLCENWVWRQWRFRAFTTDCNELDPSHPGDEYGNSPQLIINTSVEHFSSSAWFDRIPVGTIVALQGASFPHEGAEASVRSENQMQQEFPLAENWFSGSLHFDYGTWSFHRYMLIGVK